MGKAYKTKHPMYSTWAGMVARCCYKSAGNYKNYGGRGIKVCDRWLGKDGFWNFVADMGDKPQGYTLDRIDPNGNYEKDNCRWADRYTQQGNRRKNSNTNCAGISQQSSGFYLAEVGGRKTRERKVFKTLEQAKAWRDIKLKERIVGK